MIKLIIYDDNERIRQSLQWLFEYNDKFTLCGIFANCMNISSQVKQFAPDFIIMDIEMPGRSGIEAVKIAKEINPEIKILMYTVFEDENKLFESICAGANGYLLKQSQPDKLIEAITDIMNGGASLSPILAKKLLDKMKAAPIEKVLFKDDFNLSVREKQILQLLVKGHSYKQIAPKCNISIETVRRHLSNIYNKLHVSCGTEAVTKALKYKIVDFD
ncbi:MAG TPA: response regulator transcription factor [Saprospiraceae bacterium]|nr:response regulator transcription factor [Saprospiraceae bacterium]